MNDSKFKLALVRYVYDNFGYTVTEESDAFNQIAERLRGNQRATPKGEQTRWFEAGMMSFVSSKNSEISENKYRELDSNIRGYLSTLNKKRESPLKLRYYQYLSVLFTEFVLDQHHKGVLVQRFNEYIDEEFWQFDEEVLHLTEFSKLAYWMATGSGKTHIMHINILQAGIYFESEYDNLILIAPNEQIAEQHKSELSKNGISHTFIDEGQKKPYEILVTDINKLKKGESGPKTVDVKELGGENIIFVDEGHKGLGSISSSDSASGWIEKRDFLVGLDGESDGQQSGFAFEYSATFASSLSNQKGYQEYSRSIIVDYPYGRFHEDGYGKDYNILNISPDSEYAEIVQNERDKWLLSNLLSYYEKLRIFENEETVMHKNNIERPLSVFVGNSVNAVSGGSSDVQTIVEFLSGVIQNKSGWVTSVIDSVLSKDEEFAEGGLFGDRFIYLRQQADSASGLYQDLLKSLFGSNSPSELEVVRLKNLSDEEVALTTNDTESYFGVVTVGDTKDFYELIEESDNQVKTTENEIYSNSLFARIDSEQSSTDILIGSKKFAEGWDSTRPSTLGLLNLGRSEGPLVVQMFGRGVRVNGRDSDGKRADMKGIQESKKFQISRLETLDVFGVRAEYIETFKEHLEKERTEITDVETVSVDVDTQTSNSELKVPKFKKDTQTDDIPIVSLTETIGEEKIGHLLNAQDDEHRLKTPSITIQTSGSKITAEGEKTYDEELQSRKIEEFAFNIEELDVKMNDREQKLDLLNWNEIWKSTVRYKSDRGYDEIIVEKSAVRKFFEQNRYELYLPENTLRVNSLNGIERVESICVQLLSDYLDNVYSEMKKSVEYEEVVLDDLDGDWVKEHTPSSYDIQVSEPDENKEIVEQLEDFDAKQIDDTTENDKSTLSQELFRYLEQLYVPVLLDSDAFDSRGNQKEYKDVIESISPEGIDNLGEKRFINALEHHITRGDLQDYETIVMRNQANKGISIPRLDGDFYPDFVIWVSKDDTQHIILADPHGMVLGSKESDLNAIEKANDKLTEKDNVKIHGSIFARTKNNGNSLSEAKRTVAGSNNMKVPELRENHVYFVDEIGAGTQNTRIEVGKMLDDFLNL